VPEPRAQAKRVAGVPAEKSIAGLPLPALFLIVIALALPAWLDGCSSIPFTGGRKRPPPAPTVSVPVGPPPIPGQLRESFDRAVALMRAGNAEQAEIAFRQLIAEDPKLAAPYVNLGLMYRKRGQLERAEEILRSAVQRNDSSAVAWTELGVTQRIRGKFKDAALSYEHAIAADPSYAPAYRNLGVVSDLYLGDPERALTALERYKELTGEDKPVSNWIAELRQRTGKNIKPASSPASASPQKVSDPATSPPKAGNEKGDIP
jgi:tetratricopeptide (TPR) repeat protein